MIDTSGLIYTDNSFIICEGYTKELNTLNFCESTKRIKENAFANFKGKALTIPIDTEFDTGAFSFNYHLEKATIGSNNIAQGSFTWCGVRTEKGTDIKLEKAICIEDYAFRFGKIYKIDFSDMLETIGKNAFDSVNFNQTSLKLPPNLKRIELNAFSNTNLVDLYLPDSLVYWGNLRKNSKITLHMSEKLFRKMKCKTHNNIIIENESLDKLLEKYSFKELNKQQLKRDKYQEQIIK